MKYGPHELLKLRRDLEDDYDKLHKEGKGNLYIKSIYQEIDVRIDSLIDVQTKLGYGR